jgi:hypothetical protein
MTCSGDNTLDSSRGSGVRFAITEPLPDHLPIYAAAGAYENWSYFEDDPLMPSNLNPTKRLDVVEPRLEAVEVALGIRPAPPKVNRFKRAWARHRALTITLMLAGIIGPTGFTYWMTQRQDAFNDAVDRRIASVLNQPGGVQATLTDIKTTSDKTSGTLAALQPVIQDLLMHQLDTVSKLSPEALGRQLPSVSNLIQAARNVGVQVAPQVSDQLGKNLLKVPDSSPGYWPATAALISFRPQISSGGADSATPDCTDAPPHPSVISSVDLHGAVTGVKNAYYENCRFTIDSPKDDNRFNALISRSFPVIEFRHCLIVYRGGSFALILRVDRDNAPIQTLSGHGHDAMLSVHGPTMMFRLCRFDFSVQDQPPAKAKLLMQAMLQQSGPSIQVPVS